MAALCRVAGCIEPQTEEEPFCADHIRFADLDYALAHADELRQPTPDEVMQADRESLDGLFEDLGVERPGPTGRPGP